MQFLAAVIGLAVVLVYLLIVGISEAIVWTVDRLKQRRLRKRERIEAEIVRLQGEMQRSLAELGAALGADAHQARLALIRESYRHRSVSPQMADD